MTGAGTESKRRRFLKLYLRSRRVVPSTLGVLALCAVLTLWSARWATGITNLVEREQVQRNLITVVAAISATVMAQTLRSPWPEMDDAAGRWTRTTRLAVFLAAILIVSITMWVLGAFWEASHTGWMLVRAFCGWVGVTLIARSAIGESRDWLVTFAWVGLSLVSGDEWRVHYPPWAWSLQGSDSRSATVIAVGALVVGLIHLVRSSFTTKELAGNHGV